MTIAKSPIDEACRQHVEGQPHKVCTRCEGQRFVCADHPHAPWDALNIGHGCCECPASGMPCPDCNAQMPPDASPVFVGVDLASGPDWTAETEVRGDGSFDIRIHVPEIGTKETANAVLDVMSEAFMTTKEAEGLALLGEIHPTTYHAERADAEARDQEEITGATGPNWSPYSGDFWPDRPAAVHDGGAGMIAAYICSLLFIIGVGLCAAFLMGGN